LVWVAFFEGFRFSKVFALTSSGVLTAMDFFACYRLLSFLVNPFEAPVVAGFACGFGLQRQCFYC
jgi:hypothetical protein